MRVCWPIAACAILFWYSETRYFGWNQTPGSDAEVIADGICWLLWALAFGFGRRSKVVVTIERGGAA